VHHRTCLLLFTAVFLTLTEGGVGRPLEATRLCSDFKGADAGEKIAACVAALPATGGTADARGIEGDQTISVDPFAGVTKSGRLLLGAGSYVLKTPVHVPSNWTIEGVNGYATVLRASVELPTVLSGINSTGVTIADLQINGGGMAEIGITLNNSAIGASTQNRIYRARVYDTISIGISMDNNGDSTLEDVVTVISSGTSIHWDDRGGNLNMTRVTATEPKENVRLAFQTAVLEDCTVRAINITFNSEQLRSIGGYYYASQDGAAFTISSGQWLRQADFIGTRFEITDDRIQGNAAIDGRFVTGLFLTNPKFGNAGNAVNRRVFGANFGSASAQPAKLWIMGGTVATDVSHSPVFNPSGVLVDIENFVVAPGAITTRKTFGPVSNDGSATVLMSADVPGASATIIRGAASQTADLERWEDQAGNIVARITANGGIQAGTTGAVLSKMLTATVAKPQIRLPDGTAHTTMVSVAGAAAGDVALCSHDQLPAGTSVIVSAYATADAVTCSFLNKTGSELLVPSGTIRAVILKY
jgi:hypothetical protein